MHDDDVEDEDHRVDIPRLQIETLQPGQALEQRTRLLHHCAGIACLEVADELIEIDLKQAHPPYQPLTHPPVR